MTDKTAPKNAAPESPLPLHLYLSKLIDENDELTNAEIARRLGYRRPNVIAMIKTGTMKLPINKVPDLAKILGLDRISLLQRTLLEYDPELWKTIEAVMGAKVVTDNEMALITLLRGVTHGVDPDLANNPLFAEGFEALVGQAVDADVAKHLASNPDDLQQRLTAASLVNEELRKLAKTQALARQALRRKLIERSGGN